MTWLMNFLGVSVGRKQLMALSGLAMSGFLIIHLSGNLLIFAGEEAFNQYAAFLGKQAWLPLARIGLIATLFLHLFLAWTLTAQNRRARALAYSYKNPSEATLASRTMLLTGALILIYVILHLTHFTFADKSGPQGLYGVIIAKFALPRYSLCYVAAMVVLCMHLTHGIRSLFQTFGISHHKFNLLIKGLCILFAVALCLGFASIPIYIMIFKGGA